MNEAAQTKPQGTPQFYYTVAGHNILLEAGIKTEIIEQQMVFPIPHAPQWCQGMISLRGKLIPVVNLRTFFDTPRVSKSDWLLVLEQSPFPQLAVRIDRLPQQQLVNNERRQSIDGQKLPSWFEASVLLDDLTLYEANHSKLFEQLIQENEANPNRDSSGNNA